MYDPKLQARQPRSKPILSEEDRRFELAQLDFFVGFSHRHWKDKITSKIVADIIATIKDEL